MLHSSDSAPPDIDNMYLDISYPFLGPLDSRYKFLSFRITFWQVHFLSDYSESPVSPGSRRAGNKEQNADFVARGHTHAVYKAADDAGSEQLLLDNSPPHQ